MSGKGVGYGTPSPTTQQLPVTPQSGFGYGNLQIQQAGPSGASPAAVGGTLPVSVSQAQANQTAATPTQLPAGLAPTGAAPTLAPTPTPTTGITAGPQYSPTNPPPGYTYAGMSADTWAPPTPETGAGSSSAPTSIDPGSQAEYYNTAQYQAAQTAAQNTYNTQLAAYNTQLAAYNQEYAQAEAAYNAAQATYQQQLAAYNAQVAQRASWQQQLDQMLSTGLPGLQAAENMLRQELGQPIQPMTATEPTYNPYSNIGENGQPIPQGETPEQAYYASRPAPVAPSDIYTANSIGGGTVYVAPPTSIVGNPVGANAAPLETGVGGVGTQLFGTGNTPGSLNASYQAQVAAGGTGTLAGLATSGVVPSYAAGQPTIDIGTPYETPALGEAPVAPPLDTTFSDPLSGYLMPGYTPPPDQAFAGPPSTETFSEVAAPPVSDLGFAGPLPVPASAYAPSLDQQWTAPPEPAPFTPTPQFYGAPVDEGGFVQTGSGGVDESGFNYVAPQAPYGESLAQQQGFTTAGPGSGPGPVPSSADVAAAKLQGSQTLGQALSALGATASDLSQLSWIANTGAPIDLSQPIGPQLQAILPGFVYNMITDALAKYGVGTIDQLQQAIQAAQPNITPEGGDFSGQMAQPAPAIAPQMGGYESNIGQFSTGVPPDYGAAPIPSVDIPQPLPISGMASNDLEAQLQDALSQGGPFGGAVRSVLMTPPDLSGTTGVQQGTPANPFTSGDLSSILGQVRADYLNQILNDPSILSNLLGFGPEEIAGKLSTVPGMTALYNSFFNRGIGEGMPDVSDIVQNASTRIGQGFFPSGLAPTGNPAAYTGQANPETNISTAYYPGQFELKGGAGAPQYNPAFDPATPYAFMNSLQALVASLYGSPLGGLINDNGSVNVTVGKNGVLQFIPKNSTLGPEGYTVSTQKGSVNLGNQLRMLGMGP